MLCPLKDLHCKITQADERGSQRERTKDGARRWRRKKRKTEETKAGGLRTRVAADGHGKAASYQRHTVKTMCPNFRLIKTVTIPKLEGGMPL